MAGLILASRRSMICGAQRVVGIYADTIGERVRAAALVAGRRRARAAAAGPRRQARRARSPITA